jgi:hypothetical protein
MKINKSQKIKEVKKDLKEYTQWEPEQLDLFQTSEQDKEKYSNTVEIYDVMPKYYFGGVEREIGKNVHALPNLRRNFSCRKKEYALTITPASLTREDGMTVHYYPSQREELVEDVLRKFAANRKGLYLDKDAAVKFTLYEVQQELKREGHGYNTNEIKQAIEICNKSIVEITSKDGNQISHSSSIFPFVGIETNEGIIGGKNKVAVMFHPLVTKAIDENSYRLVNYERLMSYKISLARWWTKRLSHHFTQAEYEKEKKYGIKLTTLIADSAMKRYKKLSDNIIQVTKALDEMVKADAIAKYEIVKEFDEKNKRRIKDARITLYVSKAFAAEVKKANSVMNSRNKKNMVDNKEFNTKIEKIRKELEDPIYGISRTMINNIIVKITSYEEVEIVTNALAAARKYISLNPCNAAAITRAALRDGWTPGEVKKVTTKQIEKSAQSLLDENQKEIKLDNQNPIWIKILKIAKKDLDKEEFAKWFSELNFVIYQNNILYLATQTVFYRDWIKREYLKNFEESFRKVITDLKEVKIRSVDDNYYV